MTDHDERERAFLERIPPPLKAQVTHKPGFDARVMELVRAEAPLRYPGARAPWRSGTIRSAAMRCARRSSTRWIA